MNFLRAIRLILTLKCEESTRLYSEQMDQQLSFSEKWAVRLHGWICASCWRFRRQMGFLRQAAQSVGDHLPNGSSDPQLSPVARDRIRESLRGSREN